MSLGVGETEKTTKKRRKKDDIYDHLYLFMDIYHTTPIIPYYLTDDYSDRL